MNDVIAAPPTIRVPVKGGGSFPVRRIFCVGRNYGDHVREMGGDPADQLPIFFTKPADALVTGGAPTPYPLQTSDLHYELELVVAIGAAGEEIEAAAAAAHVWGYAVGLDMTRRDLQAVAKNAGQPWDMAKAFDHSAPIGDLIARTSTGDVARGAMKLLVNDQVRQAGDCDEMIWSVPAIIAALSRFVRLEPGDLIFTGTPSGVGPVVPGDRLVGTIEGVGTVETVIIPRRTE